MEFRDYYQTLKVAKTATADEVKKAYRKLARKFHPDLSKESDAAERMSQVNEAYAVLCDPEKRAAYDALGQRHASGQDFHPPPGWDEGFEFSDAGDAQGQDFSEFFASLFGRAGHAARRGHAAPDRQARQMRGEDHHAKVAVDLADAYHGATRTITLRAARLDASGHVTTDTRTLQVQIPKGVREGQHIRLMGQGSSGYGDGTPGDLYLEVHFNADPRYRVQGRDVTQTIPVAPWEAVLGASMDVPTPSGRVTVSVPAGSKNGRQLRLKGRGIPGEPAGDLYLALELVLPPADTDKARELFKTMERELAFNPRQSLYGPNT